MNRLSLWHGEVRPRPGGNALMREILARVCDARRVSTAEVLGEDRCRRIAWARQEAMAAIYATGRYSLPRIGQFFHRDHTTILHAIRRVNERTDALHNATPVPVDRRRLPHTAGLQSTADSFA